MTQLPYFLFLFSKKRERNRSLVLELAHTQWDALRLSPCRLGLRKTSSSPQCSPWTDHPDAEQMFLPYCSIITLTLHLHTVSQSLVSTWTWVSTLYTPLPDIMPSCAFTVSVSPCLIIRIYYTWRSDQERWGVFGRWVACGCSVLCWWWVFMCLSTGVT